VYIIIANRYNSIASVKDVWTTIGTVLAAKFFAAFAQYVRNNLFPAILSLPPPSAVFGFFVMPTPGVIIRLLLDATSLSATVLFCLGFSVT